MPAPNKEIGIVKLKGCRCLCGHERLPYQNDENPRVCPKFKSSDCNRPFRKQEQGKRRK